MSQWEQSHSHGFFVCQIVRVHLERPFGLGVLSEKPQHRSQLRQMFVDDVDMQSAFTKRYEVKQRGSSYADADFAAIFQPLPMGHRMTAGVLINPISLF